MLVKLLYQSTLVLQTFEYEYCKSRVRVLKNIYSRVLYSTVLHHRLITVAFSYNLYPALGGKNYSSSLILSWLNVLLVFRIAYIWKNIFFFIDSELEFNFLAKSLKILSWMDNRKCKKMKKWRHHTYLWLMSFDNEHRKKLTVGANFVANLTTNL